LENVFDQFVRAGILLRSAEPEGVALARPPDAVTVKDILEIVGHSNAPVLVNAGTAGRVLMRRDQAVEKALEGTTLGSLAEETSSAVLKFPQPGIPSR
jgi:DNA-binding IscR family transcriptional regulator